MGADKPAEAKKAIEAGKGKAGQVTQLQAKPGQPGQYKLDSVKLKGGAEGGADGKGGEEKKAYGIIIELQNKDGKPVFTLPSGNAVKFRLAVAGQVYEGTLSKTAVTGPDGSPTKGPDGKPVSKSQATITGLPEKSCKVSFPEIHKDEWNKK